MYLNKKRTLKIIIFILQAGILILFMGGFLKLFSSLPSKLNLRIIFTVIYIWFTVGINVNFMIHLIRILKDKIK